MLPILNPHCVCHPGKEAQSFLLLTWLINCFNTCNISAPVFTHWHTAGWSALFGKVVVLYHGNLPFACFKIAVTHWEERNEKVWERIKWKLFWIECYFSKWSYFNSQIRTQEQQEIIGPPARGQLCSQCWKYIGDMKSYTIPNYKASFLSPSWSQRILTTSLVNQIWTTSGSQCFDGPPPGHHSVLASSHFLVKATAKAGSSNTVFVLTRTPIDKLHFSHFGGLLLSLVRACV